MPALQQAVDEDSKAYGEVMTALQMPKETEAEKALRDQSTHGGTNSSYLDSSPCCGSDLRCPENPTESERPF